MPKLARDPRVVAKETLAATLGYYMTVKRKTDEDMAELLGVNVQTFRRKRDKETRCFIWDELVVMFRVLGVKDDDIVRTLR